LRRPAAFRRDLGPGAGARVGADIDLSLAGAVGLVGDPAAVGRERGEGFQVRSRQERPECAITFELQRVKIPLSRTDLPHEREQVRFRGDRPGDVPILPRGEQLGIARSIRPDARDLGNRTHRPAQHDPLSVARPDCRSTLRGCEPTPVLTRNIVGPRLEILEVRVDQDAEPIAAG